MLISWIVQSICPLLEQGEDLVLATVVSKSGSAPCLAGSKMLVHADGSSYGTIGGGALEAQGQQRAAEVFQTGISQHFTVDLSGRDASSMHMICGGRVEVLLEMIKADPAAIEVFASLQEALGKNERCILVSALGPEAGNIGTIERCLVRQDGAVTGLFSHPRPWLDSLAKLSHNSTYPVMTVIEGERFMVERCYIPSTVYLFGAGHISQQVAELAGRVAFQTVVLDDRAEYANRERFPTADVVKVIESFDTCCADLEIDPDSYLVIVTRGHTHDRTVLAQALRTGAAYIGMIGSRKKSVEIRRSLVAEGFSEELVNAVHCPIGLDIGAATLAEIGVSIVAELIQSRAARAK
jgi:xanthine dehydrogenase accessory factor